MLSLLSLLFFNAAPPLDVPQQGTTLTLSFEEPRQVPLTLVYIYKYIPTSYISADTARLHQVKATATPS